MLSRVHSLSVLTVLGAIALALLSCCHYPKSGIKRLSGPLSPGPAITLVAYGDTRTGPWGLGDNKEQAIHGKVVDDILQNSGSINAVMFTGDAVMTNFPLWKKEYWKCFLSQTNRFRDHGIPFYPSLGNHEVLSPIVPLRTTEAAATGFLMPQAEIQKDPRRAVAQAYESGEEPAVRREQLESAPVTAVIDPSSKNGRDQLKEWERGISRKDPESANKFGQFERHVQNTFYTQAENTRCGSDATTFSDDYLKLAKYGYLRSLLQGRSYYSQTLEKSGLRVKLIALDTNCLDSKLQQEFFANELGGFNGPVIVFGHHPPVDYDHPSTWPWDMVKGWDFFKPYLSNTEGKKIALWIFGHVHDYQRRDANGKVDQPASPVLLIAGGGGASLDGSPPTFQWQPDSWPKEPFHAPAYHQVKLAVTATSIHVEVRGTPNEGDAFQLIDSFSVSLETGNTK